MRRFAIAALVVLSLTVAAVSAAAPDADERIMVTVSADKIGSQSAVQCLTTPTEIGGLEGRRSVSIQNLGPNPIYICVENTTGGNADAGYTYTCSTATGTKLANYDSPLVLDVRDGITVYCVAASANQVSPADTRVLEVR